MSLDALLKRRSAERANAEAANDPQAEGESVAGVATIAVANSREAKTKHSKLADAHAAREAFEERAAIREFDGGFNRKEAERLAHDDLRTRVGAKW